MNKTNNYFKKFKDFMFQDNINIPHTFFIGSALFTFFLSLFFIGFIMYESIPIIRHDGLITFITGTEWHSGNEEYRIRPLIIGTALITIITLIFAVPLSVFTALFLAEFSPSRLASALRPLIELLVGIPSVVYGILGFLVLEDIFQFHIDPFLSSTLGTFIPIFHDSDPHGGSSFLLASTILTIMIIPTIISISEDAMRSVPLKFKDASFALGATHCETVKKIVLPLSLKGILTGISLGILRAMGEATAVVMLIGNNRAIPTSILDRGATLTTLIINEYAYASLGGLMASALFGIAATLIVMQFVIIFLLKLIGGTLSYETKD